MFLSPEEKYEIAQFESEALKKNIDEGRIKSDGILETLRVFFIKLKKNIYNLKKKKIKGNSRRDRYGYN